MASDDDIIRLQHPESGGVFESTRRAFNEVWAARGWQETAPDTPLTDQRYSAEGGGEPQPAPSPGSGDQAGDTPNVPQEQSQDATQTVAT